MGTDLSQVAPIVTAVMAPIGVMVVAYIGYKQSQAAAAVKQVKEDLTNANKTTDAKLSGLATVAHATHRAVNGNMEIQLRLYAVLARRMADSSKLPEDVAIAKQAENALSDHRNQRASDESQPVNLAAA